MHDRFIVKMLESSIENTLKTQKVFACVKIDLVDINDILIECFIRDGDYDPDEYNDVLQSIIDIACLECHKKAHSVNFIILVWFSAYGADVQGDQIIIKYNPLKERVNVNILRFGETKDISYNLYVTPDHEGDAYNLIMI